MCSTKISIISKTNKTHTAPSLQIQRQNKNTPTKFPILSAKHLRGIRGLSPVFQYGCAMVTLWLQ